LTVQLQDVFPLTQGGSIQDELNAIALRSRPRLYRFIPEKHPPILQHGHLLLARFVFSPDFSQ
jgi:hypothetical protein